MERGSELPDGEAAPPLHAGTEEVSTSTVEVSASTMPTREERVNRRETGRGEQLACTEVQRLQRRQEGMNELMEQMGLRLREFKAQSNEAMERATKAKADLAQSRYELKQTQEQRVLKEISGNGPRSESSWEPPPEVLWTNVEMEKRLSMGEDGPAGSLSQTAMHGIPEDRQKNLQENHVDMRQMQAHQQRMFIEQNIARRRAEHNHMVQQQMWQERQREQQQQQAWHAQQQQLQQGGVQWQVVQQEPQATWVIYNNDNIAQQNGAIPTPWINVEGGGAHMQGHGDGGGGAASASHSHPMMSGGQQGNGGEVHPGNLMHMPGNSGEGGDMLQPMHDQSIGEAMM